jgi:4-hydroxy-tetrahydrodipicolinate synthase
MTTLTLDEALRGVLPPLITPLHDDQGLDEEGFRRQLRRCLDAGCTGVFVNGSSGEGPWLTRAQRRRAVELAVEEGTVVLAGVMLPGTSMTLEAAADAERAGADAVVVAAPYYFGAGEGAIVRHVEAVAAAVSVPVILYNIPQCTHNPLTAAVVAELAPNPRVVGIKDSSGDMALLESHLAHREPHSFRVLQGAEQAMGESLRLGADGLVPGSGNVDPAVFVRLLRAVREGDQVAAQSAERAIGDLTRIYSIAPSFVGAMKAAVSLLGVCSRTTAAPLPPATDEQTEQIAGVLQEVGLAAPTVR